MEHHIPLMEGVLQPHSVLEVYHTAVWEGGRIRGYNAFSFGLSDIDSYYIYYVDANSL